MMMDLAAHVPAVAVFSGAGVQVVVEVAEADSQEAVDAREEEAPVQVGSKKFSKIVEAIARAETKTTGEIRVHISKRWFEPNPLVRAQKLFRRLGMERTSLRNAVLLYVNLRKRRFAIFGDEGIHQSVGQKYWESIAKELSQDLRGTHHENAIAAAVNKISIALAENFPLDSTHTNRQELSNDVSTD
jgi:uncharacterized membrane protein